LSILKSAFINKVIAFVTTVLLVTINSGCDNIENKKSAWDLVVDLNGDWKFSVGDDSEWASPYYNDRDWEEINVPSSWENAGYYGYNGYAWYRKTFEISADIAEADLYLSLGYVDDVDETFLNGSLIGVSGGFPPYVSTAYNALRKYYIPKQSLRKGKNIIAVRVYDIQLEGGIIKGPVGIYSIGLRNEPSADLFPEINLSGIWKFNTGDNSNWKKVEYNDSSWEGIFVPSIWEAQGFGGYDGFGWYRKSFRFPDRFSNKKMILLLGKIDDIDQTFINGKLVGEIGDWKFNEIPGSFNENNEWQIFRSYFIPDGILIPGKENLISVRVYDGMVDGGIYDGPVGLMTQEKYMQYWKNRKQN